MCALKRLQIPVFFERFWWPGRIICIVHLSRVFQNVCTHIVSDQSSHLRHCKSFIKWTFLTHHLVILQNCEEVLLSMQISQDEADTVEEGTRCQTPLNLWFQFEQNLGCKHEYVAFMHCEELESVKLTNIGLFIYTSCLHLEARPKTSVSCSCHGLGVVYIERPVSWQYGALAEAAVSVKHS